MTSNHRNRNKGKQGLTIIELLISMVLLGVLMTAVLAPLTGLFRMTGQSTQTLNATTQAQEVMEHIQAQWRSYPTSQDPQQDQQNRTARGESQNRFDRTCIPDFPSSKDGLAETISIWALDRDANPVRELTYSESCGGAAVASPMKRVTIVVTTNDPNNTASLTVDIPRP